MNSPQEDKGDNVLTPLTADNKKDKKRKYNRERLRLSRAHSIENFKLPHKAKRTKTTSALYPSDNIGKLDWDGKAPDGTFLSPDLRCLLVMSQLLSPDWDSSFLEVPHFGGVDDAKILKKYLTVHQATAIVSSVSFVNRDLLDLRLKVKKMEEKLEEQGKMLLKYRSNDARLSELEEKVAALTNLGTR
jgi:hypothetical protein